MTPSLTTETSLRMTVQMTAELTTNSSNKKAVYSQIAASVPEIIRPMIALPLKWLMKWSRPSNKRSLTITLYRQYNKPF